MRQQQTQSTTRRECKPMRTALFCFCTLLFPVSLLGLAGAQSESATSLPLLPETNGTGVRPELQTLLEDVEAQLQAATDEGNQENIDGLIALKAQLQVVELQVELEELQSENVTLLEQDAKAKTAPDASAASPEMSGMQEEVEALNDMQASTIQQLDDIAEQHAALLEQMGQAAPGITGTNAQAEAPAVDSQIAARLGQVRALNARFQKLADQQNEISKVLKVVSTEHANLLAALGVPEPAHAGTTYTVQAGDSLSSIAEAAYGSDARWPEILQANPSLTDPNILLVGVVLSIP